MDYINNKIIFFNIGWMKNYQGMANGDDIRGGGAYVQENKYGHEIFNFVPHNGFVYGFVQPPRSTSINMGRLGAGDKDSIDNFLVVWTSTEPSGGTYIIGWYKNATLFKEYQYSKNLDRVYVGEEIGYNVKAKEEDVTLLTLDERVFPIKRTGKGWMGRSNIWYADQEQNQSFKKDVMEYIFNKKLPKIKKPEGKNGIPRQTDPYLRQKIETIAIKKTFDYYENHGYHVKSKEKDNLGWDLEASINNRKLRIEVKGLSLENVNFELTPNEYEKMDMFKESYRICVVVNALKNPILKIFYYDDGSWQDKNGNALKIEERKSAKCFLGK